MQIRIAQAGENDRWNNFVDSEDGSFFHYFEWKYVYECRNQEYIPLLLEDDSGKIVGIIPLVKNKNSIFSFIESIPEGANSGILLRKDLMEGEKSRAINIIIDHINENFSKSCSHILFKESPLTSDIENKKLLVNNGFKSKYDYANELPCNYVLKLSQSFEEDIWNRLWGKDLRNEIRKGQKRGVITIIDEDLEYIDDFVEMYLYTFKRLGALPVSKEEIIKRVSIFKNKAKLFIGLHQSKPIISNLCYYTPTTCYWSKIPSSEGAYKFFSNRLITSFAIQNACENGFKYFDFGLSHTSSLASWKAQFRGTRLPVKFYEKDYSPVVTKLGRLLVLSRFSIYNTGYIWNRREELIKKYMIDRISIVR
jgi:hypothetical protein